MVSIVMTAPQKAVYSSYEVLDYVLSGLVQLTNVSIINQSSYPSFKKNSLVKIRRTTSSHVMPMRIESSTTTPVSNEAGTGTIGIGVDPNCRAISTSTIFNYFNDRSSCM